MAPPTLLSLTFDGSLVLPRQHPTPTGMHVNSQGSSQLPS